MKKGDVITVVLVVENVADAENIQRSIGQSVVINGCRIKKVAAGDAIRDAEDLMDSAAGQSHDGMLA